ncbi:hypothetical protein EYF80_011678 [Liparis tanakae]|uniref:Uncharacterized protein n=1 Tax=Liparis tanakae TaxID=230148 RepID=A0A4Z2ILY9_9TELE|nr:hypothetical protein EYF80_011678 [Liparis tanakae]
MQGRQVGHGDGGDGGERLCKTTHSIPDVATAHKLKTTEPRLTLRKVSRDPFSMNSVMIITGLPAEAHDKAAVIGAALQGGETATYHGYWDDSYS